MSPMNRIRTIQTTSSGRAERASLAPVMEFDATDRRILSILRGDGRASHAFVAKQVGLSAPAVGERIRKLEQAGVIRGYRAVLDHHALDLDVSAFVWVSPQPRKPAGSLVKRLAALPE